MTSLREAEGAAPGEEAPAPGGLLRFLTCGSVDDGKSTLIGRLLHDTKLIMDDQLAALEQDSRRHGAAGEGVDFALLVDGLEAEREQGITIDVAYRFFTTARRSFIVADTPGHEQFSRNMATGASNSDLAVILIDARKGVLTQTLRHTHIVHMLGIRQVVLAVNKMDLVGFSQARFEEIVADYASKTRATAFDAVVPIPISARHGDNVVGRSANTPWHAGPTLLGRLEEVNVGRADGARPFRMPVQWVNRPHQDFRGFCGSVASGRLALGDPVVVAGSGRETRVVRIVTADGDVPSAAEGDAVTLVLADELDIARGDVLVDPKARPEVANQFAALLFWMGGDPMLPGRPYLLKLGAATLPASVTLLEYKVDVNTQERRPGRSLALNEIGRCNVYVSQPVAFEPYAQNRRLGAFILIDRITNQTVGAGMIDCGLRRATNIHYQHVDVDKSQLSAMKNQQPCAVWFTGLSGAGKTTIANLVQRKLSVLGAHTYLLDGDNVRHGLNKDLGFSDADRVENIRRAGEVARLMVDAGLIVLCSFISPYRAERRMVRGLLDDDEFLEVFIDAPLHVAEGRDPKGLYKKARAGEIKNFTGIDSPYERPENPEVVIDTTHVSAEEAADLIVSLLRARLHAPNFK
ncbi:MAG TPA: sulfate adenylyltransferase subunit CysN [Pyrinomonadaceae bacterium]|jgi:bifunctional enzyme CysN/CysC